MFLFSLIGILELISVYSIYPFFSIILDPSILDTNNYIIFLKNILNVDNKNLILYLGLISMTSLILVNGYFLFSYHFITKLVNLFNIELSFLVLKKNLKNNYLNMVDKNSSDITTKVNIESQRFSQGFAMSLLNILSRVVALITLFIIAFVRSPIIVLATITIFLFIYFVLFKILSKKLINYGKKSSLNLTNRLNFTKESLINLKYLIVKNNIDNYLLKFKNSTINFYNSEYFKALIAIFPRFFIETIFFCFVVIILIYINKINIDQKILITEIVFFSIITYRLLPNLQQIYANFTNMKYHENLIDLFDQYLSQENVINRESVFKNELTESIKIENLSFKFPSSNKNIFNNLNLEIKKNTLTIIQGKSGSGKTTLTDLILGLYRPNSGEIYIDGKEISSINNESRSKLFSLQTQNVTLINDKLINNFYLGTNKKFTNENNKFLSNLINLFNLQSFVEKLEFKINTIISEDGKNISGGEKQRIGLVRSFFSSSSIIILDEPTNNLDEKSIIHFLNAINHLKKNFTIIVITHSDNEDFLNLADKLVSL